MKLTPIILLALLSLSVIASRASNSTTTQDDWHEKTDIVHKEGSVHSSHHRTEEASYKAKANETILGEYEVTDGVNATWETRTEHKLEVVDGKIVNTTYTRKYRTDHHKKIQKVKTIMHTKHRISNVIEVVKAFGAEYGKSLSSLEFKLLNAIIMTDENKFEMNYKIKQIKKAQLADALKRITSIFTVQVSDNDLLYWENMIVKNCSNHYQVMALDTSKVEVHRPDLWIVKTEVLMVTCGDASSPGYQLFAWSSSKTGAYHKGQYSIANSLKVDELITRWLYGNMYSMTNCKGPVIPGSESSISSNHGGVGGKSTWREHVDYNVGRRGYRVEEYTDSLDETEETEETEKTRSLNK